MKYILALLFCISSLNAIDMNVASQKTQAAPLLIGIIEKKNTDAQEQISETLKKCFMFTKQFAVEVKQFESIPSQKDLKELSKQNTLLALFITPSKNHYDWRLYNTLQGSMIAGKKYKKKGDVPRAWAYNIADVVWPMLTGQEGFFSTKITYTKLISAGKKNNVKHIYIADYNGDNQEPLIDTHTINLAPRWNSDHKNPKIFYSDFTNTNVRLMATDLEKNALVASDFQGVNMIPSFSKDGSKLVYCVSRGDGSCQLYYCAKGIFKKITHNDGNNLSPTLSDDGKIVYFCSNFESKNPQIYSYDIANEKLERLTKDGYHTAPRYNQKAQKLAYSKMVQGILQLFTYDTKSQEHTQITFDANSKEECSWSPCGTRLLYAAQDAEGKSRIAMLSLLYKDHHFLTHSKDNCSYPDWSSFYDHYPIVAVS